MTDKQYIQCTECGRVYPLADNDIWLGGDCPSEYCPANCERPKRGTMTVECDDECGTGGMTDDRQGDTRRTG